MELGNEVVGYMGITSATIVTQGCAARYREGEGVELMGTCYYESTSSEENLCLNMFLGLDNALSPTRKELIAC